MGGGDKRGVPREIGGGREKIATLVKICVAKRQAICEPIIGPEPTMKMGPEGAIVDGVEVLRGVAL